MKTNDQSNEFELAVDAILACESDDIDCVDDLVVPSPKVAEFFARLLASYGTIQGVDCKVSRASAGSIISEGYLEGSHVLLARQFTEDSEADAFDLPLIMYVLEELEGLSASGKPRHLVKRLDPKDATPLSDEEFLRFFDLQYHGPYVVKPLAQFLHDQTSSLRLHEAE